MRAVLYEDVGAVKVEEVPEPALEEPADAIVRVSISAICGSDLHVYHGKLPVQPGDLLGHEAVGVVEEVGPEVERFHRGDRVVVAFSNVCGRCWYCSLGQTALCDRLRLLGFGKARGWLDGIQAEYARVPLADVNLLPVPPDVEDEHSLLLGDVLTTGYFGAVRAGIQPGETVAVIGAGPVGYFCVQSAWILGAAQVVAIDRLDDRLELATGVGAIPVNSGEEDAADFLDRITEGRGADVAIEAVGHPSAFETARSVIRRGGRILVLGVYGPEVVELRMGHYWNGALSLLFAGMCPVHVWWETTRTLLAEGKFLVDPIISHRLSLDQAAYGYKLFDRHEAMKVMLRP